MYYPKDVSLWLTIIFLVHDPRQLVTMVDFGIFGFLIPLVNLLYTNTSIPTGESSYISIGIFTLFTETGGKDKLLPYGFRWSKSPVLSDRGGASQESLNMNLQINRLLFVCFTENRYDERTKKLSIPRGWWKWVQFAYYQSKWNA